MLSAIFSSLGGAFFDKLFGNVRGILKDYRDQKISEAEMFTKLREAILLTVREVERDHAELTAKTFESFQTTLRGSDRMQRAWAILVYTELFVLFWHQWCIPFIVMVIRANGYPNWSYPSSGSTVEWSYALLAFLFGAGAMLLRAGPGASGGILANLKSMIGK
jgi:hypothetical protein